MWKCETFALKKSKHSNSLRGKIIQFDILGVPFTSLTSDNGEFKLALELEDELILGHLVLYHVLDAKKPEKNVQLWHSDFNTRNASEAILTVSSTLNLQLSLSSFGNGLKTILV